MTETRSQDGDKVTRWRQCHKMETRPHNGDEVT